MSTDNSEKLKPYIEHLEFLGYTVEPVGEEKKFFRAKAHPTRWNFIFMPFRQGILFTVSFRCQDEAKNNELTIFKFANVLNRGFYICRAYIDNDNDLAIESCYLKGYERRDFGIFMDDIESEIRSAMEKNKDESSKILQ
jgi:hypothetical protein